MFHISVWLRGRLHVPVSCLVHGLDNEDEPDVTHCLPLSLVGPRCQSLNLQALG